MMEADFENDLRILTNALRNEGFRFVIVGHNRHSIYVDVSAWLRDKFPSRKFTEIVFTNKDYRAIINAFNEVENGIVIIPDFDWLFREGNENLCTTFNQRRDALARKNVAYICFVQPSNFRLLPKRLPDWWSLRSLELDFHREELSTTIAFQNPDEDISSLGGNTREGKEAELERLLRQVEAINPENQSLLLSIYSQISKLYFDLANYETALNYLNQSLEIAQTIGDRSGEGTALNNLATTAYAKGDYETALSYLQQSLKIQQTIGDVSGEGTTLNNISQIYDAKGDYEMALNYLNQSLKIRQIIGDISGMATTLHNMGGIAFGKKDWELAIPYFLQSYQILQKIGSPKVKLPLNYLYTIKEEIGEAKYQEIVSKLPNP